MTDRAKVGVVFQGDCKVLAEVARQNARFGAKVTSPLRAEAEIDDGVHDEFIIALAPTDDRTNFHSPTRVCETSASR